MNIQYIMNPLVSFIVTFIIVVSAQESHHKDHRQDGYHHQERRGRLATAQGHQASTSGVQGGHSSSSSSTERRQFVSRDGRTYYQHPPHVSTSGAQDRVYSSQNRNHQGRSSYSNNQRHQDGARDYPYRHQQYYNSRYYRRSASVNSTDHDSTANQADGHGSQARYNGTASRERTYRTYQGRDHSAGRANNGRVYNRYHLSGSRSRSNRTSQARNTDSVSRTRYIQPRSGSRVSDRSAYDRVSGERSSFGTAGSHRTREETGAQTRRAGASRTVAERASSGTSRTVGGRASSGTSRTVGGRAFSRTSRTVGGRASSGTSRTVGGRASSGTSRTVGGRASSYSRNAPRPWDNVDRQSRGSPRVGDECPETGMELRIDGLPCDQAVRRYGLALCYTHEFSSRKCCQACRPRRNPNKPGCEYGDRTPGCSTIRPSDCYNAENRRICCNTCKRLKRSDTPGCEYGDRSNRCGAIRAKPGLCYHPENRRMCCESCTRREDLTRPDCPWGDRNPQLCQPFENITRTVRINCYSPRTRNVCCNSCKRLKQWMPDDIPAGCEYGDQPVKFLSNQMGELTCSTYFDYFSTQHCDVPGSDVAKYCCYTCHRRRSPARG